MKMKKMKVEFENMPPTMPNKDDDGVNELYMYTDPVIPPMDAASLNFSEPDESGLYKG